jgi:hypothetical protein
MPFWFAVYQHNVRFDPAICGEDDGAIPRPLAGLDSFGDVDFTVHGDPS